MTDKIDGVTSEQNFFLFSNNHGATLACGLCDNEENDWDIDVNNNSPVEVLRLANEHWRDHQAKRAAEEVNTQAPLEDDAERLLVDLKALVDDAVATYRPQVQKILTEFGLKSFLK